MLDFRVVLAYMSKIKVNLYKIISEKIKNSCDVPGIASRG